MTTHLIEGWLKVEEVGGSYEEHDALLVRNSGLQEENEPLAVRLEFMDHKQVTVRYWVCEQKCSKEDAAEDFLRTLMGLGVSDYGARYSEYTGYLWTDEDIQVGGHDILEELKSYLGEYLILEVEVHE